MKFLIKNLYSWWEKYEKWSMKMIYLPLMQILIVHSKVATSESEWVVPKVKAVYWNLNLSELILFAETLFTFKTPAAQLSEIISTEWTSFPTAPEMEHVFVNQCIELWRVPTVHLTSAFESIVIISHSIEEKTALDYPQ